MGPVVFKYPSASRKQDKEQQQTSRAAGMGGGEARGHCLFIGKFKPTALQLRLYLQGSS
jgi:hypothetical protein